MSAKLTNAYEHKDAIGRPLAIGDVVGYADSNSLCIGTVIRTTAKMVRVRQIGDNPRWFRNDEGCLKYPTDMVLLEGTDVTLHLLRTNQ